MDATSSPSGTVTFLFTDIESHTRLWEQHPEAMPPALARHDQLVRQAIEAHDGRCPRRARRRSVRGSVG